MIDFVQIKEIANDLKAKDFEYDYIGIRVQEELYENIGDTVNHKSYVWDDGNILDEQLDGICAIDINEAHWIGDFGGYLGEYVLILGSYSAQYGNDPGEIIMRDAVVLDIIRKEAK